MGHITKKHTLSIMCRIRIPLNFNQWITINHLNLLKVLYHMNLVVYITMYDYQYNQMYLPMSLIIV